MQVIKCPLKFAKKEIGSFFFLLLLMSFCNCLNVSKTFHIIVWDKLDIANRSLSFVEAYCSLHWLFAAVQTSMRLNHKKKSFIDQVLSLTQTHIHRDLFLVYMSFEHLQICTRG